MNAYFKMASAAAGMAVLALLAVHQGSLDDATVAESSAMTGTAMPESTQPEAASGNTVEAGLLLQTEESAETCGVKPQTELLIAVTDVPSDNGENLCQQTSESS